MKLKTLISSAVACLLVVGIFCAEWENPYLDKGRASVDILQNSFLDKDTVEIFSRESLSVAVYLREHIESFKISAPKNRLWNKEDSVVMGNELKDDSFLFVVSFYDTGWHDVILTTYFTDSTQKSQPFNLYVKSPLLQKRIDIISGDSVLLETAPVEDPNVYYIWELGDTVITSENPSVKMKIDMPDTAFDGKLYVKERNREVQSSPFMFPVQINKKAIMPVLEIVCLNSQMFGDTVVVSTDTCTFTVKVTGASNLNVASVNGEQFDTNVKNTTEETFLLSKKFSKLDTLTKPLQVHVYCKNENELTKDSFFYLKYLSPKNIPQVTVKSPLADSVNTQDSLLSIVGSISDMQLTDTVTLFVSNNGVALGGKVVVKGSDWEYPLKLDSGWNKIVLEFHEGSSVGGILLDSIEKFVNYSGVTNNDTTKLVKDTVSVKDTIPPKINSIKCNEAEIVDGYIFRKDTLLLELTVTDNKKVDSVFVNGSLCSVTDRGTFVVSVKVAHKSDTLFVRAVDSSGNSCDTLITIFHNQKPALIINFDQSIIYSNSVYRIPINVTDSDGDSVTIENAVKIGENTKNCEIKDDSLELNVKEEDVGECVVKIKAYDWGDTVWQEIKFMVVKTKPKLKKIGIIPDTLWSGEDTLNLELEVESYSGTPPFTFTAFWDTTLINDEKAIKWCPTNDDTGKKELKLIVIDNLKMSDTLKYTLTVAKSPVYVNWCLTSATYREGDSVEIKAKLSSARSKSVTIPFLVEGTNDVNIGFEPIPFGGPRITFNANDTVASTWVLFRGNDGIDNKTVNFKLQKPMGSTLVGSDSIFAITILDTSKVTFSFKEAASESIEESGNGWWPNVKILVTLSKAVDKPVEIFCDLDTLSSTAINHNTFGTMDFSKGVSIVFEPGSTTDTLMLTIINDTIPEEDETIIIDLICKDSTTNNVYSGDITRHTHTIKSTERKIEFLPRSEDSIIIKDTAVYEGYDNWNPYTTYGKISISPLLSGKDSVTVDFKVIPEISTAVFGEDYSIDGIEDVNDVKKITFWATDNDLVKTVGFKFKEFENNVCDTKYVYLEITGLSDYKKAYIGNNKILKFIIKPSKCNSQNSNLYW